MSDTPVSNAAKRLAEYLRQELRADMTNHYTCLAPRTVADGTTTMTIKDDRTEKTLRVVIVEDDR